MVKCEYCKDEINTERDTHIHYRHITYENVEGGRAVTRIVDVYYCSDEHLVNDLVSDGVEVDRALVEDADPEPPASYEDKFSR